MQNHPKKPNSFNNEVLLFLQTYYSLISLNIVLHWLNHYDIAQAYLKRFDLTKYMLKSLLQFLITATE